MDGVERQDSDLPTVSRQAGCGAVDEAAVALVAVEPDPGHRDQCGRRRRVDAAPHPAAPALQRRVGADDPGFRKHHVAQRTGQEVAAARRAEERRVGKVWVSTCRHRWAPYTYKNKKTIIETKPIS